MSRGLNWRYNAVIIGAGHNGLIAAAYLGRAGDSTLVLERRDIVALVLEVSKWGRDKISQNQKNSHQRE
ncbi:MAG: NAD(P)-binding protein [Terriglobales bacterium]|jgi:thioredoxin reductase